MAKREPSRALAKVEPTKAVSPFQEMEDWFDDFFRRPFSLMRPSWWPRTVEEVSPSVDVFEEGDDVVVKAELPGIKKEDIEVNLSDDIMTISGEKKKEEKVQKKDYYSLERSFGSFRRSFRLPSEVLPDKAKAAFKDGILEIRVPKSDEAKKKTKKVAIE